MPADQWGKANLKSRARQGWFNPGGAGPTGPVAKPLTSFRRTCSRCKTNTPRRHSSLCRPCAKKAEKEPEPPPKVKARRDRVDQKAVSRMWLNVSQVYRLNGHDSETFHLLADLELALEGRDSLEGPLVPRYRELMRRLEGE